MMLGKSKLQALADRARRDVEVGLPFGGVEGCSLAIGYKGEIVFDEAFGAAKVDTPMVIMSPTKTIIESALWVLYGEGKISPADRVAAIIPEFTGGGKDAVTLEMVSTHTAAIAKKLLVNPEHDTREKRLAAFLTWEVSAVPGSTYEYDIGNGSWVLAEVIQRVSGMDHRDFLRTRILEPLGLADIRKVSLGAPEASQDVVLPHLNFIGGWSPDPQKWSPVPFEYDKPFSRALGIPGSGAVGTSTGVALLYQAFLHNPQMLWHDDVLQDARSRVRVRLPDPQGRPVVRTLSFHLAGDPSERYGERMFFGAGVSPSTFGHQGQGGQIAWADPTTGLSFCYLTNTVVFPPGGCFHPRARELSSIAAGALDED